MSQSLTKYKRRVTELEAELATTKRTSLNEPKNALRARWLELLKEKEKRGEQ